MVFEGVSVLKAFDEGDEVFGACLLDAHEVEEAFGVQGLEGGR